MAQTTTAETAAVPQYVELLRMVNGFWVSQALYVAATLGLADLLRDGPLLEEARREAQMIIAADPELRDPAHRGLREALLARWRGKLALANVG